MKIEKINESQIRCTLSKRDLMDREIRISELAYGTEKAKELFRDMMQQAAYQFGFEAEDIPLMIEAIPVSAECLVLVITKIEDPDELDTRFSKFSPEQEIDNFSPEEDVAYADEILHCFNQIDEIMGLDHETDSEEKASPSRPEAADEIEPKYVMNQANLTKFFSFRSLEEISRLSEHIINSYDGQNSIYKDSTAGKYYLVISKSQHTPEEFNRVCNIISEYGKTERTTYASFSYFEEHLEPIIKDKAIQVLGSM